MTALVLKQFTGMVPRIPPTQLPPNMAKEADNCDFSTAELVSLKGDYKLRDLANAARSLFSEDGLRFYTWPEDVDAVISPLQYGAASDNLYYTTDSDFRVASRRLVNINGGVPGGSKRVGVPKPTAKMQITVEHPKEPTPDEAKVDPEPADTYASRLASAQEAQKNMTQSATRVDKQVRAYTYAYANIANEQGPPADPVTVEVVAQTYKGVTTYSKVTIQVVFDGSADYVTINQARVYRTSASGRSSEYYFAFTMNGSSGAVTAEDSVKDAALGEVLTGWEDFPPDPGLKGLISIGNGILAAWKGNEIWFSEAYKPWAWPPSNMKSTRYPIVSAIPHGNGALVTTVGSPSLFSGVSGDAMTEYPIDLPQAGVSKWAIISLAGMALYASNDGIVALRGTQPDLSLGQRYFTRDVWRKRFRSGLSSMQFSVYDGKLIVFSKSNAFKAFMLELDEAKGAMTDLPDLKAQTALVLTTSDQMYTVYNNGLYQFSGSDPLTLRWRSPELVYPKPMALGMAQADCEGDFTIKFYQRGELGYTVVVTTGITTFRLPAQAIAGHAGLKVSDRWEVEISGKGTFRYLKCAATGRGLAEL